MAPFNAEDVVWMGNSKRKYHISLAVAHLLPCLPFDLIWNMRISTQTHIQLHLQTWTQIQFVFLLHDTSKTYFPKPEQR